MSRTGLVAGRADSDLTSRHHREITCSEDGFVVDAELVARKFGLSPDKFWQEVRRGIVYGVVERGEGEDAGRVRLTLRYRDRAWSTTLEENGSMTKRSDDAPVEMSSPACSMAEADDAYMGYAGKAELVSFLNELLEAERAGAWVTLQSAREAGTGCLAELMQAIQRDEARWCGMLTRHLTALGATPSAKVGAFYDKAMAIADLGERVAFLNRGQGWVVRKLREILPSVRDDRLHADFAEMLQSHEANIALANGVVGPTEG
jgi:hypothetical protein